MDFSQLFTWYFWAEKPTPMQDTTVQALLVAFALVVAVGIACHVIAQRKGLSGLHKAQVRAFVKPLITLGILEMVFIWLHFERVPFFSRRIWLLFILLASIVWIAHRARLAYTVYPKKYAHISGVDEREKYLPKNA